MQKLSNFYIILSLLFLFSLHTAFAADGFIYEETAINLTTELSLGELSWVDVDVDEWAPAGVTGAIIQACNESTTNHYKCAVRPKGCSLELQSYLKIAKSNHRFLYVGLDANNKFQAYIQESTYCMLYLVGWTDSAVTFFETPVNKTSSLSATNWVNIDVSGDDVPSSATGVIVQLSCTNNYNSMMVRADGSDDDRTGTSSYCRTYNAVQYLHSMCKVSSSGIFEAYTYTSYGDLRVLGYTSSPIVFKDEAEEATISTYNTWVDVDVTSQTASGATFAIIEINLASNTGSIGGTLRAHDATGEDRHTHIGLYNSGYMTAVVPLDEGEIFEAYKNHSTYPYYWVLGYCTAGSEEDTTAPNPPTTVYDGTDTTDDLYTHSHDTLYANWTGASDPESGISHYKYAIFRDASPEDELFVGWIDNVVNPSVSIDSLSLTTHETYYFSVKSVNNAIPTKLVSETACNSNGIYIWDNSPPSTVSNVYDGTDTEDDSTTTDPFELSANWAPATDPDTGIDHYQYAIGTGPGDTDIFNWTDTGNTYATVSSTYFSSPLDIYHTYYFSVKAVNGETNGGALVGNVQSSNGIQLEDTSPPSAPGAVYDAGTTDSFISLTAYWTAASDEQSHIVTYYYAIGTTGEDPYITDVTNGWKDIEGTDPLSATAIGLELEDNQTYYFSVKAVNGANIVGPVATSNGVTVQNTAPVINWVDRDPATMSLPANTSTLSIGATDENSAPNQSLTYTWSKVSGPDVTFEADNGTSTANEIVATFSAAGSYELAVTVSDGISEDDVTQDEIYITVNAASGDIIPASRCIDWDPGRESAIPNYSVDENVKNHGAVGDGVTDDTQAFIEAIAATTEGYAVYIPTGDYRLTDTITITKGIVLRGDGFDRTTLRFDSKEHGIMFQGSSPSNWTDVTGGLTKGTTQITVSSSSGFAVDDYVFIREGNDSALYTPNSHSVDQWLATEIHGQIMQIDAINGNTITLNTPLYLSYNSECDPELGKCNMLEDAGMEYLKFYRDREYGDFKKTCNIGFSWVANGWMRDVMSERGNNCHVSLSASYRVEIRTCYFYDAILHGDGGQGYGVSISSWASDCLVEDNIFECLRHSMIVQTGCQGCVFGYNYSTDPVTYDGGPGVEICVHGHYPNMTLFEGNVLNYAGIDFVWGTNGPTTLFRNRFEKLTENYTTAVDVYSFPTPIDKYFVFVYDGSEAGEINPYQNIIGNEMGINYDGDQSDTPTKIANFHNGSAETLIYHGNYYFKDIYYTGDQQWDAGIENHDLPDSYYLDSKPAFFGSKAFPLLGGDLAVADAVYTIPAQDRWDAEEYMTESTDLAIMTFYAPVAYRNESYSLELTADGGTPGYSYDKIFGSFPTGISLNGNTISGTPTAAVGNYEFTIKVTDSATPTANTATRSYTIVVDSVTIITTSLPVTYKDGIFGDEYGTYSQQLSASYGQTSYTWSLDSGSWPTGISMNSSGLITGKATAALGDYTVTVKVTDANSDTDTKHLTLSVVSQYLVNLANGTSHVDDSGNYCPYNGTLVTGFWDGDISGSNSGSPGSQTSTTIWVKFDLGTPYLTRQFRLFGDNVGTWVSDDFTIEYSLDDYTYNDLTEDPIDCTGNQWYTVDTIDDEAVNARYIKLTVDGVTSGYVQAREFEVYCQGPAVSESTVTIGTHPDAIPPVVCGFPYSCQLSALCGTTPYDWSEVGSNMPSGISIDQYGEISGTTTAVAGNYYITVRVDDEATPTPNYDTENYTLTVVNPTGNVADGDTKIDDSSNYNTSEPCPVTGFWDGDTDGESAASPASNTSEIIWVEYDLNIIWEISDIRLFGDLAGSWRSSTFTVETKETAEGEYTKVIDNEACGGNCWFSEDYESGELDARYIKLTVYGDPGSGKVQAREFEVYVHGPAD